MEIQMEEKQRGASDHEGKWVYDFTVDHKGDIPIRASTGAWKASLFIIAIEFSERLCYFGIVTNLISYLTKVLDQDLKTAAKNVNYWTGVTTMVPLIGGFLADAYIGRYRAIVISSVVYLLGLCLLTMSRYTPSLKPCDTDSCDTKNVHEVAFFIAMYLISLGTGGHKPSLESFGADQFDDHHVEERKKKMSYFNWWNFWLCGGVMLGVTVIVYVQDFVGWGVADIILTSVMATSLAILLTGTPYYRYRVPSGSPLTPMAQVLVAALSKRNLPHPPSSLQLHEVTEPQRGKSRRLCHTNKLRFLDKAAIIEEHEGRQSAEKQNPWKLATVTQVEEMKLMLNMVPVWLASLVFGICISQATTFFIKQGSTMNRKLTRSFTIPPASVFSFCAIAMIVTVSLYDRILVPTLRRMTGNERGISILQRIGIGMAFPVIAMITAAMVEKKRLHSVNEAGGQSMSVFWLAPQFIILGIGDAFAIVGLQEYFYDQVPDKMRSLGIAFYLSVIGAANFISSLLITGVDHITERSGSSWFAKDLNKSRLDNFYWLLAILGGVNLCVYIFLASRYTYKNVELRVADADSYGGGNEV